MFSDLIIGAEDGRHAHVAHARRHSQQPARLACQAAEPRLAVHSLLAAALVILWPVHRRILPPSLRVVSAPRPVRVALVPALPASLGPVVLMAH